MGGFAVLANCHLLSVPFPDPVASKCLLLGGQRASFTYRVQKGVLDAPTPILFRNLLWPVSPHLSEGQLVVVETKTVGVVLAPSLSLTTRRQESKPASARHMHKIGQISAAPRAQPSPGGGWRLATAAVTAVTARLLGQG